VSLEKQGGQKVGRRPIGPTLATFVVVAVGVYATAYLALSLLRHIVMPIIAVVVAFYAARTVFRLSRRGS